MLVLFCLKRPIGSPCCYPPLVVIFIFCSACAAFGINLKVGMCIQFRILARRKLNLNHLMAEIENMKTPRINMIYPNQDQVQDQDQDLGTKLKLIPLNWNEYPVVALPYIFLRTRTRTRPLYSAGRSLVRYIFLRDFSEGVCTSASYHAEPKYIFR